MHSKRKHQHQMPDTPHRPLGIATFNVNGIRAARRRGFDAWLAGRGLDVVALQELRCPLDEVGVFDGYRAAIDCGSIPGRNGVAILTREAPSDVRTWVSHPPRSRGLGAYAHEGRYLEVDLADVPLTVACLYLPKGGLPAHLQRALDRQRGLDAANPEYAEYRLYLTRILRELGRLPGGAAHAREADELAEGLRARDPQRAEYRDL